MKINKLSNDAFDIIIVAGQSNASGNGLGQTNTPWAIDQRIMMLSDTFTSHVESTPYGDRIEIESSGECFLTLADERDNKGVKNSAFCLYFAKKYADDFLEKDRKVLLVQTAIGGTGFALKHWGAGDKLEKRAFDLVDTALSMNDKNRVVAVLWHQGEHDIYENAHLDYNEKHDYYANKLETLIFNFKNKYGEVPFISASFCKSWILEQNQDSVNAVVDAYKTIYKKFRNTAHVYNTDDLKSNSQVVKGSSDKAHFCRQACNVLAQRYYEKFVEIIKENKL